MKNYLPKGLLDKFNYVIPLLTMMLYNEKNDLDVSRLLDSDKIFNGLFAIFLIIPLYILSMHSSTIFKLSIFITPTY